MCKFSDPDCKPVYVTHFRMWVESGLVLSGVSFEWGACKATGAVFK